MGRVDSVSQNHVEKWNRAAQTFDRFNRGLEIRHGPQKHRLFSKCRGKVLLVAAGTGLDFDHFPDGLEVTAIDFSPAMVERATAKASRMHAKIEVLEEDVQNLSFADGSFDTVVTSCTFCSVPDPVLGLKELYRVLVDNGQLLMFEHVRPGNLVLGWMMDLMTPIVRRVGPELNRPTAENVKKAGFRITREFNLYLDMVKLIEAVKKQSGPLEV